MGILDGGEHLNVDTTKHDVRRGNHFFTPCKLDTPLQLCTAQDTKRRPLCARALFREYILRHPLSEQTGTQVPDAVGASACDAKRGKKRDRNNRQGDQYFDQSKPAALSALPLHDCSLLAGAIRKPRQLATPLRFPLPHRVPSAR